MLQRMSLFLVSLMLARAVNPSHADELRYLLPDSSSGSSRAVIVGNEPLIYTKQFLPVDGSGAVIARGDASEQTQIVLDQLVASLGADAAKQIVKLNVYVTASQVVAQVNAALSRHFGERGRPAVAFVVTRLPRSQALVAIDAVAVSTDHPPRVTTSSAADHAILPRGGRIYIAGQAEKGSDLAEATRKTMQSLIATLKFLGRDESDIVQLKSFLSPMTDSEAARRAMQESLPNRVVLPTTLVEWKAPLIEIELVAWAGENAAVPAIEFLTPPGMTKSPVYSRVVRTRGDRTIFISGLLGTSAANPTEEVTSLFEQLGSVLKESGSDFRHLAKATYYCSSDGTSQKLNELRPNYYDPARPPAASKALVAGVGHADRALTIDMIAVPVGK